MYICAYYDSFAEILHALNLAIIFIERDLFLKI